MSQTLSLPPDIYSLYITPPVAGVDFSGTPTPTVSYQWRKNGTAIAGQTFLTISGVGVVQSGSTVTLADGDTISIDIILTNPVQVTTKTVSAIIDAAIPAPVISPISIRLVSAPTTPVSAIPNSGIGSQIMVASTGSVSVVTTPPLIPSYQWRRGFTAIEGATSQTYTLQAADADSIIDCVVAATGSGGTATRTATVIVGTVASVGWTELTPSSDSRLIYVSNDGNDTAAVQAKGRGYYLPSDPEIGADPTNPVGPIVAYGSVVEASKRFRGRNWNGTDSAGGIPNYTYQPAGNRNGYPDWILFRRGESYSMPVVPTAWGDKVKAVSGLIGNWVQGQGQFSYHGGGASGRSASEPGVITAWGLPSEARPIVNPFGPDSNSRDMVLASIETGRLDWSSLSSAGSSDGNTADGLLLEDVKALSFGAGNVTFMKNARFRRCVVSGNFSGSGHNQGFFLGGNDTVTIEECVFDRNGYKENPDDATTWTSGVVSGQSAGALPPGTGVQPTRTYFDRNLYLSSYDSMTLRGNIISRNGGGSSVQMREGGLAERNLFIWNESALGMTHPETDPARHKGSLAKDNVVLHDDCFLPPGGWGMGIGAGGADDDLAVVDGNIVAHFHRDNNGGQSLGVSGKSYNSATRPASQLMRGIIKDNAIYREFGGVGIMVMDTVHANGALDADVTGNAVSTSSQLSMQGNSSKPAAFTYSGNRFHSTTTNGLFRWGWESNSNGDYRFAPFTDGTFSQWQAAGFDTDGSFTTDFAAFKSAAGWTAPERDIVSYMQSADPTYVVNEDVYVDEESMVTQAVRQKVWEVLSDPAKAGNLAMSTERAKQVARRYHAFIAFIQRAKENRKGAWDTRYTAEALNNYIRAGFGKAPVTGAYDNRSLADRLQDYTT